MSQPQITDVFTNPLIEIASAPHPQTSSDRRQAKRRGSRVKVVRFGGDRRSSDERRLRSRRGFERHSLEIEAEIRRAGETATALTVDLSVLGASLAGGPNLPLGALVRVTFKIPDDLEEFPLLTWAQVVSHDEDEVVGYRFVGLRPCDARRIGRLLSPREETSLAGGHRF